MLKKYIFQIYAELLNFVQLFPTKLLSSQKIMNDHMTQKTDITTAENSGLPQK